jgi:hypothetical protein
MKTLPKIVLATLMMLGCCCVFAQDSTIIDSTGTGGTGETGSGSGLLDTIIEKAGIIIPVILGIYELLARLIPTIKDQSLVNNLIKGLQWILDKIIPNKAKDPTDPTSKSVHKSV